MPILFKGKATPINKHAYKIAIPIAIAREMGAEEWNIVVMTNEEVDRYNNQVPIATEVSTNSYNVSTEVSTPESTPQQEKVAIVLGCWNEIIGSKCTITYAMAGELIKEAGDNVDIVLHNIRKAEGKDIRTYRYFLPGIRSQVANGSQEENTYSTPIPKITPDDKAQYDTIREKQGRIAMRKIREEPNAETITLEDWKFIRYFSERYNGRSIS